MGALLLLEVVLQLGGLLVSAGGGASRGAGSAGEPGSVRILCVGESTTHGFGQVSYPARLEGLLAEKIPQVSFEVINAGLPGTHSLYLADQLESWLISYDPDWVIVMMGVNDEIYFTDLEFLAGDGRWESLLLHSRVYKLARLIWSRFAVDSSVRSPASEDDDPGDVSMGADQGSSVQELRRLRRTFDTAHREWTEGSRPAAAEVFADLIEQVRAAGQIQPDGTLLIPPEYWSVYERSQRLRSEFLVSQGRVRDAVELLSVGVQLHPENPRLRRRLIWVLEVAGEQARAAQQERELETLEEQSVLRVTVESWRRVLATARNAGVPLVAVQYPLRSINGLRRMLGEAEDVIYVENRDNFQNALSRSGWDEIFIDRFAGDFGHSTDLGNEIIAEQLLKDVFLPRYAGVAAPGPHP